MKIKVVTIEKAEHPTERDNQKESSKVANNKASINI